MDPGFFSGRRLAGSVLRPNNKTSAGFRREMRTNGKSATTGGKNFTRTQATMGSTPARAARHERGQNGGGDQDGVTPVRMRGSREL